MLKRTLVGFIVVSLILVFIYNNQAQQIQVNYIQPEIGLVEQLVNNSRAGSIKACKRSKLSMPHGGRVDKLYVKQGDKVQQGQTLLTLWNEDKLALLKQGEAQLQAAKLQQQQICLQADYASSEANRQAKLDQQHLTTDHSVEQAFSQQQVLAASCEQTKVLVKQAEAALDVQRAILSQSKLVAPFAGVIAEINGEVGEFVTPSPPGVPTPPAVDLINTDCFYVSTPIDEIDAAYIEVGQVARINLDAFGDRQFDAKVARIAPYVQEIERQARTVDVDLELQQLPTDIQLLIGYSADAQIILNRAEETLRIPTQFVQENNYVYVINDQDIIEQRTIEIGLQNWSWSQITSGLSQNDRVVTSLDNLQLTAGVKVTPVRTAND